MVNNALRATLFNGHLQRIQDELCTQVGGHRPADDLAAPGIEHDSQVQEPGPGGDIGNVRDPQFVRAGGGEVSLDQVGNGLCFGFRASLGGVWGFATANTLQIFGSHQASHTLASYVHSLVCQFGMNAGSTIGAFGVLMDLTDLLAQPLIFAGSLRQSSLAPGIVAAGGDLQHTTHGFHWIDRLVRTYESEDFEGTASVSRANQAAAFESISRSSFSCLFSLRSRASSAFSSRVRPSWRSP